MSTGTITPYRSGQRPGRDDFPHLLWAEWTKFRSVRGWVIAMVAAAALTALAVVALAGTANGGKNPAANPDTVTGPGGEAVTDNFYFVHRSLDGNGSITARVASLTGSVLPGQVPPGVTLPHGPQQWSKAGVIIKASTTPGSAYAAVMATPGHGVRMQWNYTNDTAGLPGAVSAASPRWLRLTRSGDTVTGYDSADGSHWAKIGTATLAGLPSTVQAGMFAASPQYVWASQGLASNNFTPLDTRATAVFDHASLVGGQPGTPWRAGVVGGSSVVAGPANGNNKGCPPHEPRDRVCVGKHVLAAGGLTRSGGAFTVRAYGGDIAPYVTNVDPLGTVFKGTAIGLIAVIALGALFITAEYRRGLIRTTLAASPRRGRVLAAKAIVIGSVTFVAGLAGAAIALPVAEHRLHSLGWASSVYPVWSLTSGRGLQIVVGSAGLLAVAAILALSAGTVLRRSAGAITAVVVLVIVPLILGAILPQTYADWLLRITPAAAFGLQQGIPQYSQVMHVCQPYNGCYPLAPWTGLAVAAAWAAAGLGLAIYQLRRRDA
jgi:regulation of enolase protein 1 (concanavalin A-like superfamily)